MTLRRRRDLLLGPASQAASGHNILTITDNGAGGPRITTAAPHGLTGSETITISSTVTYDGVYNGGIGDFAVIDATHFDLTTTFFSSPTSGGRWD